MPLTTSWVRPESRFSVSRAAVCGGRFAVDLAVERDDRVDAEDRVAPGAARAAAAALASALARATSTGSPAAISSTSTASTSKAIPSCSRIARRCGERLARIRGRRAAWAPSGERRQRLQSRRRCRERARGAPAPVRAGAARPPTRRRSRSRSRARRTPSESEPWTRLRRISVAKSPRIEPGAASEAVRRADQLAAGGDRVRALEDHRDERARGDERRRGRRRRACPRARRSGAWRSSSSSVMSFSAASRRPLRSKRAMISPVSPRANASGLTRIRVRSIGWMSPRSSGGSGFGAQPRLASDVAWLCLAIRAELPGRIQRPAAVAARVTQLAHAVGTA